MYAASVRDERGLGSLSSSCRVSSTETAFLDSVTQIDAYANKTYLYNGVLAHMFHHLEDSHMIWQIFGTKNKKASMKLHHNID